MQMEPWIHLTPPSPEVLSVDGWVGADEPPSGGECGPHMGRQVFFLKDRPQAQGTATVDPGIERRQKSKPEVHLTFFGEI